MPSTVRTPSGAALRVPVPSLSLSDSSVQRPRDAASFIVELLNALGVDAVFGVPGGAIEPLTNALAVSERRGGTRLIVARHETGAAFMAESYARASGRLGVCCATSGPGATNLLTGVATACESNVPMLVLTGQPQIPAHGRRALQESSSAGVDVVAMFSECSRFSAMISHSDQVQPMAAAAILRAMQAPQGPVHLSVPVDLLRAPVRADLDPAAFAHLASPRDLTDLLAVEHLLAELRRSDDPVFVLGRGCEGAVVEILRVIEAVGAPFVVTPDAKGLLGSSHPLYQGVLGFAGHDTARTALSRQTDLIVLVGSRVSEWTSAAWNDVLLSSRLIHVDADPEHFLHSPVARLHVRGNIAEVFEHIDGDLDRLDRERGALPGRAILSASTLEAVDRAAEAGQSVRPQRLMSELSSRLPANARIIADAGNSTAWAINRMERPGGHDPDPPARPWLDVLMDFAPMGWAIGGAIGLAVAQRDAPVVCLTGDGSWLMNGQEITVAAQEGLSIIFVILNDSAYGMVKHGQRLAGAEQVGFELNEVDYADVARAMGVDAHVIATPEDFDAVDFHAIARREAPTLLDVRIDGEQVPPMGLRMQTLNES